MRTYKKEQSAIHANVKIEVHRNGKLIREEKIRNLVVAEGRDLVRDLLGGQPTAYPTHIALGTSATAVLDADVALGTEGYRDTITTRRSFTSRIQYQLYINQAAGNGNTYTEAGIFNVLNETDRLFARTTFAGIVKTAADTITLTWDITITSS